jgi:hypothetical protein
MGLLIFDLFLFVLAKGLKIVVFYFRNVSINNRSICANTSTRRSYGTNDVVVNAFYPPDVPTEHFGFFRSTMFYRTFRFLRLTMFLQNNSGF